MRYIKKEAIVEAYKVNDSEIEEIFLRQDTSTNVPAWMIEAINKRTITIDYGCVVVNDGKDPSICTQGDYIVLNDDKELEVYTEKDFKKLYKALKEDRF